MAALEEMMGNLIKALEANTAAHLGKAAPAAGKPAATAGKPAATAPSVTFEAVKAAAVKVKEKSGAPVSKKIIKDHGKSDSLNAVKPENYAALLAACEAHLATEEPAAEEADEEL